MSSNKLALIRYKIIDECLRQRHRKWTLENLMEKVANGLYELEGINSGVSKRTIQGDIQLMRSNKLGYEAPIVVTDKKYYTYSDPEYSISNSPISSNDMDKMKEALDVLKQLNGFSFFNEMTEMIVKLDNKILSSQDNKEGIVQMEGNNLLKGLEWLTPLYKAIKNEIPLLIRYKSFRSLSENTEIYFPYLLKEYRNRWFLICKKKKSQGLTNLALDRILEIDEMAKSNFEAYDGVNFERYFADTIGVSKTERDRGNKIILKFEANTAPYIETKPLHHSQQVIKKEDDGSIVIRIDVVHNLELEREILGFADCVEVISPRILRNRIKKRIAKNLAQYSESESNKN